MTEETTKLLNSVQLRIALPALATVGLFVIAMYMVLLPSLEQEFTAQKLESSKRLVEAALGVVQDHYDLAASGRVDEKTSKEIAIQHLHNLRYGEDGKEYFWIIDTTPKAIMHPYRPDLEGKDLGDITDSDGVALFDEMVRIVAENGKGEVRYRWQWKDQVDRVEQKISWVQGFKPWGWIIGTGVYLDDVQMEVQLIKQEILYIAALVTLGALLLAGVVVFQARRAARERERIWNEREDLVGELEQQRERYRSLVDHLETGVLRVDPELQVMAANQQFVKWFPEIVPGSGARCLEIFGIGPDEPVPDDCPVQLTLGDGQVHETSRGVIVKGQERQLRIVSSPVPAPGGGMSSVIVMLDDFTEQAEHDRVLAEAEAKYRGIFENAVEGIYQTTLSGGVLSANPALAQVFGYESPEEFIAKTTKVSGNIYVQPGRRQEFLDILQRDGVVSDFESEINTDKGNTFWVVENARAVRNENGDITHIDGIMLDVTSRKQAEVDLERQRIYFRELFESSPLAIVLADAGGTVLKVNKGFELLFGFDADELVSNRSRDIIVPDNKATESDALLRAISQGQTVTKETVRMHKDGTLLPVQLVGYPFEVDKRFGGAYHIYQDITERKSFEKRLSHQAFHDALTALPNRTLFMERLSRAVQRGRRREQYNFAAMMIDLDRFKRINDTMGHQAGDQLLMGVALRILSCIRTVDTVARLGGDEFAVLLEEFDNPREVVQVANRIRDLVKDPFHIDGQEVYVGASIGIVLDVREYTRADEILRDADIAMYQCKERGKDRLVFNQRMHDEVMEVGQMEAELRTALAGNQLVLHYQPIVHVESGELQGFEALVRWNHPTRGMLPPMDFIPMAEETGLIIPLGRWVLREACKQMAGWCSKEDDRCQQGVSMSVNLSARQFAQPDLVEYIQGLLESNALDATRLKLEITETVLMEDAKQAAHKLKRLKTLGVKIMIDDFGTGYSSLSYLQQFPVDYLKIDKTFISGEGNEADNREIVNTIIMLARNLGLKVVAEGVEEQEHLDMLKELNCDDAQGFMFSKPVDKSQATDILQEFMSLLGKRES